MTTLNTTCHSFRCEHGVICLSWNNDQRCGIISFLCTSDQRHGLMCFLWNNDLRHGIIFFLWNNEQRRGVISFLWDNDQRPAMWHIFFLVERPTTWRNFFLVEQRPTTSHVEYFFLVEKDLPLGIGFPGVTLGLGMGVPPTPGETPAGTVGDTPGG